MQGEYQTYDLTEEQESRVRDAVAKYPECRVIITDDEYEAFKSGQEQAKPAASVPSTQKEEEKKAEAEPVEEESKQAMTGRRERRKKNRKCCIQ